MPDLVYLQYQLTKSLFMRITNILKLDNGKRTYLETEIVFNNPKKKPSYFPFPLFVYQDGFLYYTSNNGFTTESIYMGSFKKCLKFIFSL